MNWLDFSGKNGLILGVANDKSIAYGIAKMLNDLGANMVLSYQGEILKKRVEPISQLLNAKIFECDVSKEDDLDRLFEFLNKPEIFNGKLDFIVHSVAFADKDGLRGKYYDTTKENCLRSIDISAFSLVSIARRAKDLMHGNGSIITLSYLGSERVIENYNLMGSVKAFLESTVRYLANDLGELNIRVNSLSAGPIRTLASSAIGDFSSFLDFTENNAPLKRNVTLEDIAKTAIFLLSDMSSGVTGGNIYVDCGYNIIGSPKLNK